MSNILGISRITRMQKFLTWMFVTVPFLGLVAGIYFGWGKGVDYRHLILFAAFYAVTFMSITVGFHRLITHKSFKTFSLVKGFFAIVGSFSGQLPVKDWKDEHLIHHPNSDKPGDPHSPHLFGAGTFNLVRGFFHAHVGWLFQVRSVNLRESVRDLRAEPYLKIISKLYLLWVALGLLLPAIIGGIWCHSWKGAFLGFLWGGLIRMFFVHHVTWSVNSVCHIWGKQDFKTTDHSKNNWWLAVLSFGESWHNGHHAFEYSAKHGLLPGQFDISYLIIRFLERIRLAWDVKVPSKEQILAKLTPEGLKNYARAFV